MYHTGLDPFTKKEVFVAKHLRDRKVQRALLQFFKPENYFEVRKALEDAGRHDLIGSGCDALIPDRPPREAFLKRREQANRAVREAFVHQPRVASRGYRPKRATAVRRKNQTFVSVDFRFLRTVKNTLIKPPTIARANHKRFLSMKVDILGEASSF